MITVGEREREREREGEGEFGYGTFVAAFGFESEGVRSIHESTIHASTVTAWHWGGSGLVQLLGLGVLLQTAFSFTVRTPYCWGQG